jgi:hypothetical protein
MYLYMFFFVIKLFLYCNIKEKKRVIVGRVKIKVGNKVRCAVIIIMIQLYYNLIYIIWYIITALTFSPSVRDIQK